MWRADVPYNDLPAPPRAALETVTTLKAAIAARAELAALNQALRRVPNPSVLISALPLLEAQASSEVENIVTTTDELFQYAETPLHAINLEVKETLRYRTALFAGISSMRQRPITARTAVEVCTQVQGYEVRIRDLAGTFIGDSRVGTVRYTPPEGAATIRAKLSDWEHFIHNSSDLDPLIVMAAAHYQFEAIHPFADGNGRTGRILNILLLLHFQLLDEPVLYLSRHLIAHRSAYYDLLLGVTRDENWEDWLIFMLEAVRVTAAATLALIDRIEALRNDVADELQQLRLTARRSDLLNTLFELPYLRIHNLVDRCGVSRQTAAKWLHALVAAGRLREQRAGRETLFVNDAFIRILASR